MESPTPPIRQALPEPGGLTEILPRELTKQTLSMLPLPEFQQHYEQETEKALPHLCTWDDRFWYRYGTKLPEPPMGVTVETEECRYLFWAAYRSSAPEVGYRSHLILDRTNCLHRAIEQNDAALAKYFIEIHPVLYRGQNETTQLAIQRGMSEVVRLLEQYGTFDKEHWRSKPLQIPNVTEAVFALHRDFPLAEVHKCAMRHPGLRLANRWIEVVCGLIASQQQEKVALATGMLQQQLSGDQVKPELLLRALGYLGDWDLFRKAWPRLKEQLAQSAVLDELIAVGASTLMQELLELEGPDYFSDPELPKRLRHLTDGPDCYALKPEGFPAVLDFLHAHCHPDGMRDSFLCASIYAFSGDRRVLQSSLRDTEDSIHRSELLFERGHHALLKEFLETVVVDSTNWVGVFDDLLPFLLDNDLSVELTDFEPYHVHLSLAQWEKLAEHFPDYAIYVFNLQSPTSELCEILAELAQMDEEDGRPYKLVTQAVTWWDVKEGERERDYEFMEYFLRRTARLARAARKGDSEAARALQEVLNSDKPK